MPVPPIRSTAEEWIWSTSALTPRLLARSSCSSSSVLASAGGLQGQPARLVGRISGGLQVGGQGLRRPGQAADRSGEAFGDGIFGFGLDHGERGAGQRPHVAHRQVYLIGRPGVELHVSEAPPPGRGEAGGLPAGRDGLFQSAHPRVDLPGHRVSPSGPSLASPSSRASATSSSTEADSSKTG